jgi:miniconductance mechanosensitive channel
MGDKIDMMRFWISLLEGQNISAEWAGHIAGILVGVSIIVISVLSTLFVKRVVVARLNYYIENNTIKWDNAIVEHRVLNRLVHFVPAMTIYLFAQSFPNYSEVIQRLSLAYMIIAAIITLIALLDAISDIYLNFEISKVKSITVLIQVLKISVWILGGIGFIATLLNKSPVLLFSGIGALAAVLSFVFKDTLLGLVASAQLAANDMVRIGDWIEMPKQNADGFVTDITLYTVKVQNWDRTITTIPTYSLISDSFKNWRGMQQSGGRRIKRSIYIDATSIKFCTEEMLERFEKFQYISGYIKQKKEELEKHNKENHVDPTQLVNGRRLTNIGTFRAYIQAYLKNHPGIHSGMIQMARHLTPTEHGLPIEVYAFTNDTAWVKYEAIQADIFDHILAVIPQFDLRLHQIPTGYDLRSINPQAGSTQQDGAIRTDHVGQQSATPTATPAALADE